MASALQPCLGTWSLPLYSPAPQPLLQLTLSLHKSKGFMTPWKSHLCDTMVLPSLCPTIRCLAPVSLSSWSLDLPLRTIALLRVHLLSKRCFAFRACADSVLLSFLGSNVHLLGLVL
ncbi:hypothetical protein B296_00037297 [Ensete ventricosum]|uniref:Uncharacterized protein n=1 Tax=Ensete ventricosum TaxID=4639 RepID=A0A426YBZ4_ENSVE|nr:hypothetical protein B296_00037297 [Ensete ventricosum]